MNKLTIFDENKYCRNVSFCRSKSFCKNLINNTKTILCIWTLDGALVKFNNYAEKITGYSENEVLGPKWKSTIADTAIETKTAKVFDKLLNGESHNEADLEGKLLCKNGSYIDILWSNFFMYDRNGNVEFIVGLGMDISAQKRDELTGLSNRSSLCNKTSLEIIKIKQNGKKLALLYIDLDNFKAINDSLGHTAGNRLIKEISRRLYDFIQSHRKVARIGEDEFAILFSYKEDKEEIKAFAKKIIKIINHPVLIDEKELYITASIGIAIYNDHGDNFEDLIENADIAMYHAKELGRNRFCFFTKELNEKIIENAELITSLRRALINNEFTVFYQPQINLKTSELDGMEALIRWDYPKKGMISPDKFIPLAEDTGLIIPIGNKVLYEACRQNKEWQDQGYKPVRVAVNLSAKQFEKENLVEVIEGVLEETGLEPKYLEIEITESTVMKDFDFSIRMLKRLRKMGIHISLDDFGTGYSSLNYLKKLPIDTLKIDKTFVDNIRVDIKDEIIAKAIIELAHNMGLKVVAEGVEFLEQLKFLKQNSCDKVQGFLFSPPVPAKEFKLNLRRITATGTLSTAIRSKQ